MIRKIFNDFVDSFFASFQNVSLLPETPAFSIDTSINTLNCIGLLEKIEALNIFAREKGIDLQVEEKDQGIDELPEGSLTALIEIKGDVDNSNNKQLTINIDMSSAEKFEQDLNALEQLFFSEAKKLGLEIISQPPISQPPISQP